MFMNGTTLTDEQRDYPCVNMKYEMADSSLNGPFSDKLDVTDSNEGDNTSMTTVSNSGPSPGEIVSNIIQSISGLAGSHNVSTRSSLFLMPSDAKDPSLSVIFHCWICDEEYDGKLGLINHLKEVHSDVPELSGIEKRMKVPICLKCGVSGGCEHNTPNDEGDHEEDDQEHDFVDLYNFPVSNNSFAKDFRCQFCNAIFKTHNARRIHQRREHPKEKSHHCTYCSASFYTHNKLVVHTRSHTGYKPYVCGVCGSKFTKNSDLSRHARIHSGEKPFTCAQCGQTFTQKCSLEKHARRHAKKDGGFPCTQCGLTFAVVELLDEHMTAKHGERTWKCNLCGKSFEAQRYLMMHERAHQNMNSFACKLCDRRFSQKHLLDKHEERIHNRKDDLTCKVCNKEFRRRENLNRHMNIHLEKKEFQCAECGMAFTEKGSLKRHVQSRHDNFRPYVCRECGKACTRRFLLRKHHVRHHPGAPFDPIVIKEEDQSSLVGNYGGGMMASEGGDNVTAGSTLDE